mgnify:CR=1 FL=1
MNEIDTNFDFTTDTPKFWDNFWNNNDGFGCKSTRVNENCYSR